MSFFASLGIVVIAALILSFLQLTPGVFALFHHYASGKFSRKKASYFNLFFILGVETVATALLLSMLLLSNLYFLSAPRPESGFIAWILTGIIIALAIASLIAYYRRGAGSKLFIPRRCADTLDTYARTADSRSDAFILGALSGVLELPFTLPLYLVAAVSLIRLSAGFPPFLLLGLIIMLAPTIPLFTIHLRYHSGYTLADIMRTRARDKSFIRLALTFSYTALAILYICFGVAI